MTQTHANANRKVTNRYFVFKLDETLHDLRQNLVCIHELLPILLKLSNLLKSNNSKIIKFLWNITQEWKGGGVNVKKFPMTPLAFATFLIY